VTAFFLPDRLTRGKSLAERRLPLLVERRFVQLSPPHATERSERFRGLLLRGAVILASVTNGDTHGTA
jgi:hypothetical protein